MGETKSPESLVQRAASGGLATMQAETCSKRRAGLETKTRFQARIVNYADDFVILCRGSADRAMAAMRDMMQRRCMR